MNGNLLTPETRKDKDNVKKLCYEAMCAMTKFSRDCGPTNEDGSRRRGAVQSSTQRNQ